MHRWGIFPTKTGWEFIPPVDLQAPQLQNTGLLDKNGKEIYEGDILRFKTEWADGKVEEMMKVVVWQHAGLRPNGFPQWHLLQDTEVIGNLYENSELLN